MSLFKKPISATFREGDPMPPSAEHLTVHIDGVLQSFSCITCHCPHDLKPGWTTREMPSDSGTVQIDGTGVPLR